MSLRLEKQQGQGETVSELTHLPGDGFSKRDSVVINPIPRVPPTGRHPKAWGHGLGSRVPALNAQGPGFNTQYHKWGLMMHTCVPILGRQRQESQKFKVIFTQQEAQAM